MWIRLFDIEKVKLVGAKYALPAVFVIYLIATSIFYVFAIANVPTQNGDNIEHIHSAFLVAMGQVPYRDFFQHHNPLLWYLFAPLVNIFAYNSTITEIVSLISFLVFLKSLVYIYRIGAEFLMTKLWALIVAAAVITPIYKLFAVDFRPDNYMVFCLLGGLYYYFSYLRDKKTHLLVIAFLWFILSFFFAQKALFSLAIIGLSGLYFWYKGEIRTSDMLKALIIPLVMCGLFFWYLLYYDMLELYYLSNYTFNLNLAAGFEFNKVVDFPFYTIVLSVVGFIGAGFSLGRKNYALSVLALLFISEFLQRVFYFSPYAYYYWWMMHLGALLGGVALCRLDTHFKFISLSVAVGMYFLLYQAVGFYYSLYKVTEHKPYLPDYITRQITPCDYVFNGDGMMYNIFGKDPAYYWQLIGQLDVIGEKTGIYPRPNINEAILLYKPKFVFGKSYFNKFSNENGRPEIVHYVDTAILEKYYDKTDFPSIYWLKPKYHKKCALHK